MKKILSILMVLALAASCMFVFASCGGSGGSSAKPNKDYEEAAEALEDADYTVDVDDSDEDCIIVTAQKGMNVIEIRYLADEDDVDDNYDELKEMADEYQDEIDEAIENAEEMAEEMEEQLKEAEEMAKELGMDLDEIYEMIGIDPDEFDVDALKKIKVASGKSGTMVWAGTVDAIKAAK